MGIFRRVFGPSKEEVWRQLAKQIGAEVTEGRWGSGIKVAAHVDEWTITLDCYVVPAGKTVLVFTRMRAPYVNRDGLRFSISRRGLFSNLAHALGAQDIDVGDRTFDQDFVVKGNDERKVRELLSNATIRRLLEAQPRVHFEVKPDEGWFGPTFPEGVDELCFHSLGIVKDIDQLKSLYDLFAEVLHQLCRMGTAYERDPGVTLT